MADVQAGAMIVTITQAKEQLQRLIDLALAGEDVVIARRRRPMVKITPVETPAKERVFGSMKGEFALTDAFFDPLPDDELALWNGEGD